MTVLSYRARRFVRHHLSWHNIRFQWTIVCCMIFALGVAMGCAVNWLTESVVPGVVISIGVCGFVAAPFLLAAIEFPMPLQEPWLVKKYGDLKDWWSKVSEPARIGTFEGKAVLERWVYGDFRSIYDASGHLIATEQTIDWSSTDPDWRVGDPKDIQTCVTHFDGSERLSWLARFRSPKLPAGNQADILNHNNEVLGQTTYTIN